MKGSDCANRGLQKPKNGHLLIWTFFFVANISKSMMNQRLIFDGLAVLGVLNMMNELVLY